MKALPSETFSANFSTEEELDIVYQIVEGRQKSRLKVDLNTLQHLQPYNMMVRLSHSNSSDCFDQNWPKLSATNKLSYVNAHSDELYIDGR